MFQLTQPQRNFNPKRGVIMFDDLSIEAQRRVLRLKGITSPEEMFLDVVPLAYTHDTMELASQIQIDDEALCQCGAYRM